MERHRHSGLYLLLLKDEACFIPRPPSEPEGWQLYPAHDGRNARRTKGKRESFKKTWGRKEGRGGSRYWKEAVSYWLSLCWFLFALVSLALRCCCAFLLRPVPNLTFLIQITGGEWTCLENTVAFLGVKHTILHALTWRVSRCTLRSVARPFYCQQKTFN